MDMSTGGWNWFTGGLSTGGHGLAKKTIDSILRLSIYLSTIYW